MVDNLPVPRGPVTKLRGILGLKEGSMLVTEPAEGGILPRPAFTTSPSGVPKQERAINLSARRP
jgi:hypothetical protein